MPCVGFAVSILARPVAKRDRRIYPTLLPVWQAELQVHREEVYKCMYARGIGTRSSSLYLEWADYYELSGDAARAMEILQQGVNMLAQPLETVKSAFR